MSSIGPQLPPHLAKRKRTPESDSVAASPPAKVSRSRGTADPNEISLDSSDDDDNSPGPGAAPRRRSPRPQKPSIGPMMPPGATANADEIDLSDSGSDAGPAPAMGPSMPRTATPGSRNAPKPARKPIGPSMPPARPNPDELDLSDPEPGPAPAPKRTYGPSFPAAPAGPSDRPRSPISDSDSDSDYGPSLPSTSRRPAQPLPETARSAPSKRDEWMLAPPTAASHHPTDTTKLKSRTFRSGPGAQAPAAGASSVWTETAAEKLSRLQNAVLGRGADDPSGGAATGNTAAEEEEARKRGRIEEYTAQTRGKSLYEERREARKAGRATAPSGGGRGKGGDEEEDDPSKRPFDREKDMALGGRLGSAQKREFVGKAANFGDRFAKGSYL